MRGWMTSYWVAVIASCAAPSVAPPQPPPVAPVLAPPSATTTTTSSSAPPAPLEPAAACTPLASEPLVHRGGYALVHADDAVRVIRVDSDTCAVAIGELPVTGPFAFAQLVDDRAASEPPPDVAVDTWLMHGDRLSTRFHWVSGAYVAGERREIPGPHRLK